MFRQLIPAEPKRKRDESSSDSSSQSESEDEQLALVAKADFLDYRISIPVRNIQEVIQDLRKDEEFEQLESCGSITERVFKYLWPKIGRSDPVPILAMYSDDPDDNTFNMPKLREEFPFSGFGDDQQAVHFVFQGENGAWEDLSGTHYSHEYAIFQSEHRYWSCQAWAGEYETRWQELDEPGLMTSTLNMSNIVEEDLKKYFYLDDVPIGFGSQRRYSEDYLE